MLLEIKYKKRKRILIQLVPKKLFSFVFSLSEIKNT